MPRLVATNAEVILEPTNHAVDNTRRFHDFDMVVAALDEDSLDEEAPESPFTTSKTSTQSSAHGMDGDEYNAHDKWATGTSVFSDSDSWFEGFESSRSDTVGKCTRPQKVVLKRPSPKRCEQPAESEELDVVMSEEAVPPLYELEVNVTPNKKRKQDAVEDVAVAVKKAPIVEPITPTAKQPTSSVLHTPPADVVEVRPQFPTKEAQQLNALKTKARKATGNPGQTQWAEPQVHINKCSTESTSEFPISSPSDILLDGERMPPKRQPLLKNTLPADSFERNLATIGQKSRMTIEEKIGTWECNSELSDVEDVNNFDELFRQHEELKQRLIKMRTKHASLNFNEIVGALASAGYDKEDLHPYDFTHFRTKMIRQLYSPPQQNWRQSESSAHNVDRPNTSAVAHLAAQRQLIAAAEAERKKRKQMQIEKAQNSTTPPATSSSESELECYPSASQKRRSSSMKHHDLETYPSSSDDNDNGGGRTKPETATTAATLAAAMRYKQGSQSKQQQQQQQQYKHQQHQQEQKSNRCSHTGWTDGIAKTLFLKPPKCETRKTPTKLENLKEKLTTPPTQPPPPTTNSQTQPSKGLIQMRLDFLEDKKHLQLKKKANEIFKTPSLPSKYSKKYDDDGVTSNNNNSDKSLPQRDGTSTSPSNTLLTPVSISIESLNVAEPTAAAAAAEAGNTTKLDGDVGNTDGTEFHQQHEFCNYLGLTGMSTANAVANAVAELANCNLARRSLRVRRLQQQEKQEKQQEKERDKDRERDMDKEQEREKENKNSRSLLDKLELQPKWRQQGGRESAPAMLYSVEALPTTSSNDRNDYAADELNMKEDRNECAKQPRRKQSSLNWSTPSAHVQFGDSSKDNAKKKPEIKIICQINAKEKPTESATRLLHSPIQTPAVVHRSGERQSPHASAHRSLSCASDGRKRSNVAEIALSPRTSETLIASTSTITLKPPAAQPLSKRPLIAKRRPTREKSPTTRANPLKVVQNKFHTFLQNSRRSKPTICIVQSFGSMESNKSTAPTAALKSPAHNVSSRPPRAEPNQVENDASAEVDSGCSRQSKIERITRHSQRNQTSCKKSNDAVVELADVSLDEPPKTRAKPSVKTPMATSRVKTRLHKLLSRTSLLPQRQLRNRKIVFVKAIKRVIKRKEQSTVTTVDKAIGTHDSDSSPYLGVLWQHQDLSAFKTCPAVCANAVAGAGAGTSSSTDGHQPKHRAATSCDCSMSSAKSVSGSKSGSDAKSVSDAKSQPEEQNHKILASVDETQNDRPFNSIRKKQRSQHNATKLLSSEPATDSRIRGGGGGGGGVDDDDGGGAAIAGAEPEGAACSITASLKKSPGESAGARTQRPKHYHRNHRHNRNKDRNSNNEQVTSTTTDMVNGLNHKQTTTTTRSAPAAPPTDRHAAIGKESRRSSALLSLPSRLKTLVHTKDIATQFTQEPYIHYLTKPTRPWQNPLSSEFGRVLYIYFEMDVLIAVQDLLVSFWKYSKCIDAITPTTRTLYMHKQHQQQQQVANMMSSIIHEPVGRETVTEDWLPLGECKRLSYDKEISAPYQNRICINNSIAVYVELRCRELPRHRRDCNLLSMYVNVYYFHDEEMCAKMHSIQLDAVQSSPSNVVYTTIPESRYFIVAWPQENIIGKIRSGLCKYSLTPQMDTLASIREFKSMRHEVLYLECIGDDKLLGFGATQLTIWDHRSGDVLMNYDLQMKLGRNLGSLYYPSMELDQNSMLLLFQYVLRTTAEASFEELVIIACQVSHVAPTHRIIKRHKLPMPQFGHIQNAISTGDHLVITATNDEEVWLSCGNPTVMICVPPQHTTRFYARDRTQLIEMTSSTLTVDSFANHVLKLAAMGLTGNHN